MSMNIKNEEAHWLARKVSALTGESLTSAVTTALRERLERIEGPAAEDRVDSILSIAGRSGPRLEGVDLDHGSLLYDDQGLPR
jgi:antitoxin VapB